MKNGLHKEAINSKDDRSPAFPDLSDLHMVSIRTIWPIEVHLIGLFRLSIVGSPSSREPNLGNTKPPLLPST
jgi:hypothetical protein